MASTTFSPLRHRTFLFILLGSLFSNFGNAIQSVGAAWQLTATGQPADVVALVQSAMNLPIMLLALPAGTWADMFDKRRVMLTAQAAMFALSILLVLLQIAGITSPALIIGLTTLLACGVACFNPALAASVGSIVPRAELGAGIALNILAFNVARSLGPAIGGGIVAIGGAKAAFAVNALSYLMVIVILMRWRIALPPSGPPRPLPVVIGEGFSFAIGSSQIRTVLLRAFTFTLCGSAAWALMPLVATQMLGEGSVTFGLLLGALGLGAVIGAGSSTWFRQRFTSETIIRAAGLVYGAVCVCVALGPGLVPSLLLLVLGGAGWVQALSGCAVAGQMWSPPPLIGRVTAMVSSLTFGGLALGSWLWGHFAEAFGVTAALMGSGALMIVLPLIGLIWPMPRHEDAKPA